MGPIQRVQVLEFKKNDQEDGSNKQVQIDGFKWTGLNWRVQADESK